MLIYDIVIQKLKLKLIVSCILILIARFFYTLKTFMYLYKYYIIILFIRKFKPKSKIDKIIII